MELDPKTQSEIVVGRLRALILDGAYRPGEPLRQDALAEELNVSRTPLRHALYALAEDGLVEITGFRGARVSAVHPRMVDDLFGMRLLLEPLALQSAFHKHTKLDLAEAEIALEAARAELAPSRLSDLNWTFHRSLYRPSDRPMLLRTIGQLNKAAALAEVIASSIAARPTESADEHRSILNACKRGDENSAISLLKTHLQLAHEGIKKGFH